MNFYEALKYPFQGQGWFRRILGLALIQFLPLVGQLILIGYGIEVVRAIYSGQKDLPPIKWKRALGDGVRLVLAGILYLKPLIGIVPLMLTLGTGGTSGNLNLLGIALSVVTGLLLFLVAIGLHISGVRHAIENRGLFNATASARLFFKHRAASATLTFNFVLLYLTAIVATCLGLALLLVPGAVAFVICFIALWYLLACYGMEIGIDKTSLPAKKSFFRFFKR